MIRVIRIRTLIEDRKSGKRDEATYIEGCEAIMRARKYINEEKVEIPHHSTVSAARALPKNTPEEKEKRLEAIKQAKQAIEDARTHNEEIEIAQFVMRELNRFTTEFGKKQYELSKMIYDGGAEHFHDRDKEIIAFAHALPESDVKEEKMWRKQEIKNAKMLESSKRLALQCYPDGVITYDPEKADRAYNMPDDTKEKAKVRRQAMKAAPD